MCRADRLGLGSFTSLGRDGMAPPCSPARSAIAAPMHAVAPPPRGSGWHHDNCSIAARLMSVTAPGWRVPADVGCRHVQKRQGLAVAMREGTRLPGPGAPSRDGETAAINHPALVPTAHRVRPRHGCGTGCAPSRRPIGRGDRTAERWVGHGPTRLDAVGGRAVGKLCWVAAGLRGSDSRTTSS
jgi:hypothetical protein